MALRKALGHRFMSIAMPSATRPPTRPPAVVGRLTATATPPKRLALPVGDELVERIMRMSGDRIHRLEGPLPPERSSDEARKVVRAMEMERVRAKLSGTERSWVSYSEFVGICGEAAEAERGTEIARCLDKAGIVIVLGKVVFLRPAEIANAIERVFLLQLVGDEDPERRKELKKMEEKKAEIDGKAEDQVRRELWCGLVFLVLQTAGFMRLTFWELSWDVMEPICFFVTSTHFLAGYAFFLRTSRDPSFQGFFESRFAAKQKRLFDTYKFDLKRFNELSRASPCSSSVPCCDRHHRRSRPQLSAKRS